MLASIFFQSLLAIAVPATFAPAPPTSGLVLQCPEIYKVPCGSSIDPSVSGLPVILSGCDDPDDPNDVTITWVDTVAPATCPSQRFVEIIHRTFTVTDGCGETTTCRQQLHIIKRFVNLDLHPRSCPNPFNRGGGGVYPAAICGSASLDVTQIDPNSLRISLHNCVGGSVAPIRWSYEDVVTAFTPDTVCGCTTQGPDGFLDLTFKLDKRAMEAALGLGSFPNFSFVTVVVTGQLADGCEFIGQDCIRVQ
jgi:hypothetical protein